MSARPTWHPKAPLLEITEASGDIPLGSSGIQIRFETNLIIEAIRPTRVVRIRPATWRNVMLPPEETIGDQADPGRRFPTPAIFQK